MYMKTDSGDLDWRRELLQAVRTVFDSEREWLHSQLQAFMATTTQMDLTPLLDQLKKLFQKQVLRSPAYDAAFDAAIAILNEFKCFYSLTILILFQEEQQWRSLEQLFNADRHSLLAEVRTLHAQLHASTQQSPDQLRQLQDSLHTAKEQGMETQHQLHKDGMFFTINLRKKVLENQQKTGRF